MFKQLFAVEFNHKKFILFSTEDHRFTFLEWKDGRTVYPELSDYIALSKIYNNYDYRIHYVERIKFTEKVNWKGLLLTLILQGSFALGTTHFVFKPLANNIVAIMEPHKSDITSREDLSIYFEDKITRNDVVEAINNNPNIPDYYKELAIEVMDINLRIDSEVDLRIYYENVSRMKLVIVKEDDPEYQNMKYAGGWFNTSEQTIYIWEKYQKVSFVALHEFNHAFHDMYMKKDGHQISIYETLGFSLEEAMTEYIVNGDRPFMESYVIQRNVLKYFMNHTDKFNYHTYNTKGIMGLIEELKENYPDVDIDYIVTYLDAWTISRNSGLHQLDLYNYSDFTDELFGIAINSIDKENPYGAFYEFIQLSDNTNPNLIKNYLNKYNEKLMSMGCYKEKDIPELIDVCYENFEAESMTIEEAKEYFDPLFQEILNNMNQENLYVDLDHFLTVLEKGGNTDVGRSLNRYYCDLYDQEVINRGFLTKETITNIREIDSEIQINGKYYLSYEEDNFIAASSIGGNLVIFQLGRNYHTTILSENGQRESISLSDELLTLRRIFFIKQENILLRYIVTHPGATLKTLASQESIEEISKENHFFDERDYNTLENGETVFEKLTPDIVVEVGLDENKKLGFQLKRGEEILYHTCNQFSTPTASVPYQYYTLFNHDYIKSLTVDYFLSEEYFQHIPFQLFEYFFPNVKRTKIDNDIYQEDYSTFEYEFEEQKYLILDGKTYSLKDIYFFLDYVKNEDIEEYLYLHIPDEDDIYVGNYRELNCNIYGITFFDEILEKQGIEIPESGKIALSRTEIKEILRQYMYDENQKGQKK